MAWILLAGPRAGWLNAAFRQLAGGDRVLFDIYSLTGIILVLTLHYAPYAYLLIIAALQGVDPGLENASRVSGAGMLLTLRRVVFPVVTPAILSALLLIFTLACEHCPVVTLLGVTGKIPSLQYDIYSSMVEFPNRPNYAAAASLVLLLMAVSALGLYNHFTRRQQRFVTVTGKPTPPRLTRLGGWRWPAVGLCLLYFALAVVVPLLSLVLGSLLKFITPNLAPSLFTIDNFRLITQRPEALPAFRNTLLYGLVTATAVVLLAGYVSHTVTRRQTRLAPALGVLAMLPASLPSLTLGLGVLWGYVRFVPAIYGTVWILLLAYLTRLLPYGVRVLTGSIVQLDAELEQAARLSGSPPRQMLRRIVLPLVWPALVAAWVLVFTQAILEVSMTVLLYTAPTTTVAINIWFYNFGGQAVLAYSLSTILAAIGLVMLLLSSRLRLEHVRALAA
jgi:iron(III) transport system permease protein